MGGPKRLIAEPCILGDKHGPHVGEDRVPALLHMGASFLRIPQFLNVLIHPPPEVLPLFRNPTGDTPNGVEDVIGNGTDCLRLLDRIPHRLIQTFDPVAMVLLQELQNLARKFITLLKTSRERGELNLQRQKRRGGPESRQDRRALRTGGGGPAHGRGDPAVG